MQMPVRGRDVLVGAENHVFGWIMYFAKSCLLPQLVSIQPLLNDFNSSNCGASSVGRFYYLSAKDCESRQLKPHSH